jgi:hypothetical protein
MGQDIWTSRQIRDRNSYKLNLVRKNTRVFLKDLGELRVYPIFVVFAFLNAPLVVFDETYHRHYYTSINPQKLHVDTGKEKRVNRKMNESGSQEMLTASGLRREKNSWKVNIPTSA